MEFNNSLLKTFTKKIEGYNFSLLELFFSAAIIVLLTILVISNLNVTNQRSFETMAQSTYDKLKQTIYSDMSSPNPTRRYLMKHIVGPGSLPPPFEDLFLKDGIILNYLIRVYEPAKMGRPKDHLRFEVTHAKSGNVYRYTEVNGVVFEQVVAKEKEIGQEK